MLSPNDLLAGKYKILTEIGRGGMGRVWLAMDTSLNKQWAVKEIDKTSVEYKATVNEDQTLTEIELMKRLDHPLLPRIVDIIDKKDSLCVVMDYIEGVTLLKVLKMQGPQQQELVAEWMMEICEVLDYLHHLDPPIIYRDMKPANIMLKPDGSIRVIDFGIARTLKKGLDDTVCLGTKGYASPEHFLGKTDVRSDVYTVGVSMYYLLTGKNPAEPPYEIVPLREVDSTLSSGLEKIIAKATDPDPDKRYQSAALLGEAIAGYRKLEEPYIRGLKKKISTFKKLSVTAIIFLIGAGVLFGSSVIKENNTYEDLLNRENTNIVIREAELSKAISIKPARKDAYVQLIREYAKDGFTESEASEFLGIYNENKTKLERDSKEYAELNFEIGQAFLLYYTGATDNSDRNRLITAAPFFKGAANEEFSLKNLAKGYYDIATFYQDYIIGSNSLVVKEAGRQDYEQIIKTMNQMTANIEESIGDGAVQLQMVTYDLFLALLEDARQGFFNSGFSKEELLMIVNEIIEKVNAATPDAEVTESKRAAVLKRASALLNRVEATCQYVKKKERG